MALTIDTALRNDFETHMSVPADPVNSTFLGASEKFIARLIDRDMTDEDLQSQDTKLALYKYALHLLNSRDFMSERERKNTIAQVKTLLAGVMNLSRTITSEDSNA